MPLFYSMKQLNDALAAIWKEKLYTSTWQNQAAKQNREILSIHFFPVVKEQKILTVVSISMASF